MRYWILFYKFSTSQGQQGNGYIHLTTKEKHISLSVATTSIENQLWDKFHMPGAKVSITSFNELSEEDYKDSQ